MIAIYARQSIDKKDSISIETQIEACKRELAQDEDFKVYQDKGFSGKNTDRPAFMKLIRALENGSISKIIVYRLDRISRSITDFANIIDLLELHKVDFVSTSEKFDTSTPVGRAMLYIIMVFAQLERETIAERIRDNYYSRGKTGAWLGGPAPFGFQNAKVAVGNKKVPTLAPNEDLKIVKEIYTMYSMQGSTLGTVAKQIRDQYGGMWNNVKLSRILHNPAYVKADTKVYQYYASQKCMIVNQPEDFTGRKGCNLYGRRERSNNKYRLTGEHVLSLALHDGVIDADLWLKCQHRMERNRQLKNTGKGKHSWLTGIVKCGYCGYAMGIKICGGVKYLSCTGRYATDLCFPEKLSTHYVSDVEECIQERLWERVAPLQGREIIRRAANGTEACPVQQELARIDQQIRRLLERLTQADEVSMTYVNEKLRELDQQRNACTDKLNNMAKGKEKIEAPCIHDWNALRPEIQRSIAQRMIKKVKIYNDKMEVVWKY